MSLSLVDLHWHSIQLRGVGLVRQSFSAGESSVHTVCFEDFSLEKLLSVLVLLEKGLVCTL